MTIASRTLCLPARPSVDDLVSKHPLHDRTKVEEPSQGDRKPSALRDATSLYLPNPQEAFSVTLPEVMACGTLVVISRACSVSNVAEHRAGEMSNPDPRAIATALLRTVTNREWREHAGSADRRMRLATHDSSQIAQGMIKDCEHD